MAPRRQEPEDDFLDEIGGPRSAAQKIQVNRAFLSEHARGKKKALSRRQWNERFVKIRSIDSQIIPLVYNSAQRILEAAILRQERAGLPVRQIIGKARKCGFSSLVEANIFQDCVRDSQQRGLIVAHDDQTTGEVLRMARTMLEEFVDDDGRKVEFGMRNQASYHLAWLPPISSEIQIASAAKREPGRGFTPSRLHVSEMAIWQDDEEKAQALFNAMPKTKNTHVYIESTGKGDRGGFRDRFWAAWKERDRPLRRRTGAFNALFMPWYFHPGYRWSATRGNGEPPSDEQVMEIHRTLTEHERWLLTRTYLKRWTPQDEWECTSVFNGKREVKKWRRKNVGLVNVDYDQLAWRRAQIIDEFNGDPQDPETWDRFKSEFPATPEEMFLSTGSAVFSATQIHKRLELAVPATWRGEIADLVIQDGQMAGSADLAWSDKRFKLVDSPRGALEIWEHPLPGEEFVVGVDTSKGGLNSDLASASVVNRRTRALVAAWNGLFEPVEWGRMCVRLALYYNRALLGFETHPSQHGLSACNSARDMGYHNLYRRKSVGTVTMRVTEELGFATTVKTKPGLIDRVRIALKEEWGNPSRELLQQLLEAKRDEAGDVVFERHDDFFVSYAIALAICYELGDLVVDGEVPTKPLTFEERWWAHKREREAQWQADSDDGMVHRRKVVRAYDGT